MMKTELPYWPVKELSPKNDYIYRPAPLLRREELTLM